MIRDFHGAIGAVGFLCMFFGIATANLPLALVGVPLSLLMIVLDLRRDG